MFVRRLAATTTTPTAITARPLQLQWAVCRRPLSAPLATAAAAAKPAAAAAAAKPAAAAGAAKAAPTPAVTVAMKKGLRSYFVSPRYEITVPAQAPYMSAYQKRVAKKMKPIAPVAFKLYGEGLKVALSSDSRSILIEARNGKATVPLHESVAAALDESKEYVLLSAVPMHINAKSMLGTTRAHLANAIHGVHFGHTRRLKLVGIGYRAKVEGQLIEMRVGFSHPVFYTVPPGVTASMPAKDTIALRGVDIHAVMLTAAQIRKLRPPNAYTGQGIRYSNEVFVAKPGKKKSS